MELVWPGTRHQEEALSNRSDEKIARGVLTAMLAVNVAIAAVRELQK